MHNYRKLDVWHASVDVATRTYEVTDAFPRIERYELAKQMRRSAVSIGSNIAEGSSRRTAKDFARFLDIAQGSAFELAHQISVARRRDYGVPEELSSLEEDAHRIGAMLTRLKQAVTNQREIEDR